MLTNLMKIIKREAVLQADLVPEIQVAMIQNSQFNDVDAQFYVKKLHFCKRPCLMIENYHF